MGVSKHARIWQAFRALAVLDCALCRACGLRQEDEHYREASSEVHNASKAPRQSFQKRTRAELCTVRNQRRFEEN